MKLDRFELDHDARGAMMVRVQVLDFSRYNPSNNYVLHDDYKAEVALTKFDLAPALPASGEGARFVL